MANWTWCGPKSGSGWRPIPTTPRRCRWRAKSCWIPTSRREAAASFRRAYQLDPDPRTRELFRDTLLEGLRTDFAAYRGSAAEIERLLDNPSQQAAYLRLMADGLRRADEPAAALDYYQKLIDLEPDRRPLDEISKMLAVRRDRWIRSQLAGLRSEAKGPAAAKIDRAVEARLKAAMAASSIEPLQRFFDYFGELPAAAAARDELIRRLERRGPAAGGGTGRGPDGQSPTKREARGTRNRLAHRPSGSRAAGRRTTGCWQCVRPRGRGDAGQPGALLPRPVAAIRPESADDCRLRRLGARAVAGVAVAERQQQSFAYNAWTQARVQRPSVVGLAGMEAGGDRYVGVGAQRAPRMLWSQDLIGSDLDPLNRQMALQLRHPALAVAAAVWPRRKDSRTCSAPSAASTFASSGSAI